MLTFYQNQRSVLSPKAYRKGSKVLSALLSISVLRDASQWRSRRPTQVREKAWNCSGKGTRVGGGTHGAPTPFWLP